MTKASVNNLVYMMKSVSSIDKMTIEILLELLSLRIRSIDDGENSVIIF